MRIAAAALLLTLAPLRAQEVLTRAPSVQRVPPPGADSALDARVRGVAEKLRCPVCQGESIQDSPAELSTQMKDLVREQLANGRTEAQVIAYFVEKYGDWILLEPPASGINWIVYIAPVVFLVGGAAFVLGATRKWTKVSPIPGSDPGG